MLINIVLYNFGFAVSIPHILKKQSLQADDLSSLHTIHIPISSAYKL